MGAADKSIVPVLEAKRPPRSADELAAALREAREYTLAIYAHLDEQQQRFPYRATINPARWEVGHIGWFQEFWCRRHSASDPGGLRTPPRIAQADQWWDSRHVPHAIRWDLPLPDWEGIREYLAATLDDTLERLAASRDGERYFFELALYHEDMHGEALLMTLQTLALPAPARSRERRDHLASLAPATADDATFAGGEFELGAAPDDARHRFVFDNEKWAHPVTLRPFAIARSCVTEGEFARFVQSGGYERPSLWSAEGRRWRATSGRGHPAYWRPRNEHWEVREFDRWRALDEHVPVQHVNAFEAEAYCAWIGRRLPTEAEWEFAALSGEIPVHAAAWQWTADAFGPYPGFAADPYAEYSAPWFGDHRSLRGASWATRSRLAHARFRNFYRPERYDMFVGIRTCAPA